MIVIVIVVVVLVFVVVVIVVLVVNIVVVAIIVVVAVVADIVVIAHICRHIYIYTYKFIFGSLQPCILTPCHNFLLNKNIYIYIYLASACHLLSGHSALVISISSSNRRRRNGINIILLSIVQNII